MGIFEKKSETVLSPYFFSLSVSLSLSTMAEAHEAVAFAFNVTPGGVEFNYSTHLLQVEKRERERERMI